MLDCEVVVLVDFVEVLVGWVDMLVILVELLVDLVVVTVTQDGVSIQAHAVLRNSSARSSSCPKR